MSKFDSVFHFGIFNTQYAIHIQLILFNSTIFPKVMLQSLCDASFHAEHDYISHFSLTQTVFELLNKK